MVETLKKSIDAKGIPYFMHLIRNASGGVIRAMTYRYHNLPKSLYHLLPNS